ncbi:MAG: HlyD family type I secretion periplasmic adaptor subunit [Gammaproteobacteria bacterium]|nr:HlyD family type I secretion periplasmic adaptor subunit [Gammaproteobacteria bacterium]
MNLSHNEDNVGQVEFDTDLATHKKFGLTVFIILFGLGGLWAVTAPIDGAAVAPGLVTSRSYSKVVQHLEGGIIKNIFVENGAKVRLGDPILEIDSTQPKAQLEITNSQLISLKALEVRLSAERDRAANLNYASSFIGESRRAQEEGSAQIEIFNARKSALEGGIAVLEQRIEQLQTQITGYKGLRESKESLSDSYNEELRDVRELLNQGFSDKNRLREIERNVATLDGDIAQLIASIAESELAIGETTLQILQQRNEFQNQVVSELRDVQVNISDQLERSNALEDIVSRTLVSATESGTVNGLQVHTIGGVITPGMQLVNIVPEEDDLIVEANISATDIDRVAVGQAATIRFSTFSTGSVPNIFGTVINISADSFQDELLGTYYYLARIEVAPDSLNELGELALVPGMPAEVFIATGARTLLQYLLKPLSNSLARGLRED